MSRSTKLIVIVSNLAAIWLTATLASRGIQSVLLPTVSALALSWLVAVVLGDVVTSVVLSLIYVVPAACFIWYNTFNFSYYAIWLAGLCGSMLPRALRSAWAFPGRFAAPLVFWALVLALTWPIVVLREVDFVPALLVHPAIGARLPQSPTTISVWIASVTSIALTGLLFLDWLFAAYTADRLRAFESRIIWPMFAGAVCAAAVAVYQSLVDMSFLNHTPFESYRRVVGTMRDANPFGSVMALWLPVGAAMIISTARRWYVAAAWSAMFLMFAIALWASGSRIGLLAGMIGLFVVIAQVWRSLTARQLLGGILCAIAMVATVALLVPSTTVMRLRNMVPSFSSQGFRDTAFQLWSRDSYGTAAVQMIAEHPLVGVGVGGFLFQYGDLLYLWNGSVRPPDNAQNWFRQQLAELGVLGSVGWIAAAAMFAWLIIRRRDAQGRSVKGAASLGGIIGLVAASMLGIPTQDTAASITFVVIACWYMKLTGVDAFRSPVNSSRPFRRERAAILLVLGCFLGGTVYEARTELRPARRALRVASPYSYGFLPDTNDPTLLWTDAKAVQVFPAEKRWLKLVIGDVAPDAALKPVRVRVSINRELILQVDRRGNFPLTRWIRMPADGTRLLMQIDVSRTWRPSDFGGASDERARGVAVREWSFWDEDPPKGSVTFESPPAPMGGEPR